MYCLVNYLIELRQTISLPSPLSPPLTLSKSRKWPGAFFTVIEMIIEIFGEDEASLAWSGLLPLRIAPQAP